MNRAILLVAATMVMCVCGVTRAGLIIDVTQSGNNVVFQTEAGGTLSLAGLTYSYTGGNNGTSITPATAILGSLPDSRINMDVYTGFTSAPSSFGTNGFNNFGSGTGTPFVLYGPLGYLEVQSGFTGGAVSFTDTFSNATFTSLGLTPGTYTWTWTSDSVELIIPGTASVPETASLVMTIGGLGLVSLAGRWRFRRLA